VKRRAQQNYPFSREIYMMKGICLGEKANQKSSREPAIGRAGASVFASFKPENEKPSAQDLERVACFSHHFAKIDILPRPVVQPKLVVGSPGDKYEQEADRVAERVMGISEPRAASSCACSIQGNCRKCEEAELKLQSIEDEKDLLQSKEITGQNAETTPDLESSINAIRGGGKPLTESERAFFEPRFGCNFRQVRLNMDARAAEAARAINARAFTSGKNIIFGSGEYLAGTRKGQFLLAHELTHVVQQLPHLHVARTPGDECLTGHREGEGQIYGDEYWMWGTWRGGESRINWGMRIIDNWITWRFGRNISTRTRARISGILLSGQIHEYSVPTTPGCQYIFFFERNRISAIVRLVRQEQSHLSESHGTGGRPSEIISEMQPESRTAPESTERGGRVASIIGLGRAVEETERLSEEPVVEITEDLSVLENAQLANHYLDVLEHYARRRIFEEDRSAAIDGLSREELSRIVNDNPLRRAITSLYSQGYLEYTASGGSELDHFFRLQETIIEQFVRGNPTATHNQLRISHGEPEGDVLGIVHRQSGFLYYDAQGFPLPAFGGPGMRDRGYVGSEQPEYGLNIANIRDPGIRMFLNALRQTFSDPTRMTLEAAQIYFNNVERVNDRVRNGPPPLGESILRQFEQSLPFFVGFLAGHGLSTFLIRVPNPAVAAIGLALKGLLAAAGYIMSIDFAGQALRHLLDAAYHLSRVGQNEQGELTGLSERHLRAAAHPIRQMTIEVALSLGAFFLTRGISGTIRCSRCSFLRVGRRRVFRPIRTSGASQRWWPRISTVSGDWATKGAHIHVGGIELGVRPTIGGGISFRSIFSGQNPRQVAAAARTARRALEDMGFRQRLFNAIGREIENLGSEAGGIGAELRHLMHNLERMGL